MLIVTSLENAPSAFETYRPRRVVSLLSEEETLPVFAGLEPDAHLKLYVLQESCAASISAAAQSRARELVDFARSLTDDGDILVHCKRGVSRSTAAAFVILCARYPDRPEDELMRIVRRAAPHADPCPLFVNYADDILGRDGRMLDALEDLCPPVPTISAPAAIVQVAA